LENAEDKVGDKGGPYGKSWDHGADFYRIDGSVNLKEREDYCEKFNDVNNTRYIFLYFFLLLLIYYKVYCKLIYFQDASIIIVDKSF